MEVYTIGFTKKSAEQFFGILKDHGVRRLVDVRLNNSSQLAGFTKRDDLSFFLRELLNAEYVHEPLLAPTPELLTRYRKEGGSWSAYERDFLALLAARQVELQLERTSFETPTALLCSEQTADRCHRRLVLEYLREFWPEVHAKHL